MALSGLGDLHTDAGRHDDAVRHHEQALHLYRDIGVPHSEAAALAALEKARAAAL